MAVDTFAEAEALVDDVGPRAPGSDGARAAAEHLAVRLRALGRSVEIEPFAVWPRWPLAYALHALAGITASLLSLVEPGIAVALAGLVTLLTVLDATALLTTTRRLLGRRASRPTWCRGATGHASVRSCWWLTATAAPAGWPRTTGFVAGSRGCRVPRGRGCAG